MESKIANTSIPSTDQSLMDESLSVELDRAMSSILKDRENDILKMFFGIGDYQEMSLEEIGENFGLTRERVRQIKERALQQLRHSNRKELLRNFL